MKQKVLSTFKKRLKCILKTELNARNVMTAIGEYAVPVLSYTFGIINWTEEEIKDVDVVRKHLNLYRMFEINSDVDRLYVPRAMGGRGLMSVWDSFRCTTVRVSHYLNFSNDVHVQTCANFEKNTLFSLTKKAQKFSEALNFTIPAGLENKPLLRQAKLISQKFKEYIHKQRYETFLAKPQHGVFF